MRGEKGKEDIQVSERRATRDETGVQVGVVGRELETGNIEKMKGNLMIDLHAFRGLMHPGNPLGAQRFPWLSSTESFLHLGRAYPLPHGSDMRHRARESLPRNQDALPSLVRS